MKAPSFFAIASVFMLVIGLALANTPNSPRLLVPGRSASIAYPTEILCYFLAAFFCIVAFIESIWYIPLGKTMIVWHSWLSLGSAALFVLGTGLWFIAMYQPPDFLQRFTAAILGPILIGIPVFVLAQAWFCVGLVCALVKMRT